MTGRKGGKGESNSFSFTGGRGGEKGGGEIPPFLLAHTSSKSDDERGRKDPSLKFSRRKGGIRQSFPTLDLVIFKKKIILQYYIQLCYD